MSRNRKIILLALISSPIIVIIINLGYLLWLSPDDKFPVDTFLDSEEHKSALIIVAHDDDAVLFAGTSSMLADKDWEINFVCFYTDKWRPEENPVRKEEMKKVKSILGLNDLMLVDLTLRIGLDTISKPWLPVPLEDFEKSFMKDSLKYYIKIAINKYKPSVIFIVDRDYGFYGHPEHVLIGRMAEEVCYSEKERPGFPVKRIYQAVIPESYAERLLGDISNLAAIFPSEGIPQPQVENNIRDYANIKKSVMKAHASQHRNIKKFMPYYHFYPGWIYFRIFPKEYFNIIEL